MKKQIILGIALLAGLAACDQKSETANSGAVELTNGVDSFSYYIGLSFGKDIRSTGIEELNEEYVKRGIEDVFDNDSISVNPQIIDYYVRNYIDKIERANNDKEQKALEAWIKENRDFSQVVAANEGYYYRVITEGSGDKPGITDVVTVHYTGSLLNGEVFDSSVGGDPVKMPLNRFIRGWAFGVMNMNVGAKYELFIPSFLAYGPTTGPTGTLPPNSALVFEVELLDIEKKSEE